uniref:Uncharacterized protein n=1 Tax=Trypanosoma vivax (strain Y486) TaxID=1055687 RepID=G0TY09_TRYVY|nr:hypothetical protein, unlikely [Trypanosoma vivax Y486]
MGRITTEEDNNKMVMKQSKTKKQLRWERYKQRRYQSKRDTRLESSSFVVIIAVVVLPLTVSKEKKRKRKKKKKKKNPFLLFFFLFCICLLLLLFLHSLPLRHHFRHFQLVLSLAALLRSPSSH